jgi:uncharacterized protein YoxC
MTDYANDKIYKGLFEQIDEKDKVIDMLLSEMAELKHEKEVLIKRNDPKGEYQKTIKANQILHEAAEQHDKQIEWHVRFQERIFKELGNAKDTIKVLEDQIATIRHAEQQLLIQLKEYQSKANKLESRHYFHSAIKKDANGNPITNEAIITLYEKGVKIKELSRRFGLSDQQIRNRLANEGVYKKRTTTEYEK